MNNITEDPMRAVWALVLGLITTAAQALPVFVDFSVTQETAFGRYQPGTFSGTWSFDDSLARPGVVLDDPYFGRRLESFSFTWLGHHWHPRNARLARLEFDAGGQLRSWTIGGIAVSGGCIAVGVLNCVGTPTLFTDFTLTGTRLEEGIPPPEVTAVGVLPRIDGFADAWGSFSVRQTPVPAPGASLLVASLLSGLAISRWRSQA